MGQGVDIHRNRPGPKIVSAYWDETIQAALEDFKSGDPEDRDSILDQTVESAVQDALFVEEEAELPVVVAKSRPAQR